MPHSMVCSDLLSASRVKKGGLTGQQFWNGIGGRKSDVFSILRVGWVACE
jgi:hypothetical protein